MTLQEPLPEKAGREPARTSDATYYPPLSDDILIGVNELSMYTLGRTDKKAVRATYFRFECPRTPSFHWRGRLCARKSTLLAFIWAQEIRGLEQKDALLMKTHTALQAALPLLDRLASSSSSEDAKLLAALEVARASIEQLLDRHSA